MCRIGLIDDEKGEYENYRYRLELRNIDLLFIDYKADYNQIFDWILDNRIEVLLIDYKLDKLYDFNGSKLFQFINNKIPDLQCMLFTSNPAEDDLVVENLIVDKNVFTSDNKFNEFVGILKQASKVFNNRQLETINQYKELLLKKEKNILNPYEEKVFVEIYKRLVSYGIIEKIPDKLLESNFEKAIDDLIRDVENYVKRDDKDE